MSQSKEFQKEQQFVQAYFKHIYESSSKVIDKFINERLEQLKKDGEATTKANILNETKEGNGRVALHFASSRGDLNIFKYLLSNGAILTLKDSKNNSVLMIAVQHKRKEIVTYLLDELHYNVNEERDGIFAIHLASQQGDIPLVDLLLDHGANINQPSQFGTPLMFAAAEQQNWLAHHLLKRGADINLIIPQMPPILHLIIDQDNKELFKLVIEEFKDKVDINIKDMSGCSTIQLCAELGRVEMIQELINQGADVNYEMDGYTALDIAVQKGNWACVENLRQIALRKEPILQQAIDQKDLSESELKSLLDECLSNKVEGNQKFMERLFDEALPIYQEIVRKATPLLKVYPEQITPFYTNLAQTYIHLNQPQQALDTCRSARTINPKWPKIYYIEGAAYEMKNEYGEAAASYFDGLKLDQNPLFKQMFEKAIAKGKALHQEKQQHNKQ